MLLKEVWWWWWCGVRLVLVHFLLQPPPSQERQCGRRACVGRAGRLRRARQHSQNPAGEWCTPSFCLLPCAKTYIRAGVPRPAHGFTSGLFHRHGSGGVAARHVTTLVATWWWWEKLYQRYYSIAEKAPARLPSILFLKVLFLLRLPVELSQAQCPHDFIGTYFTGQPREHKLEHL